MVANKEEITFEIMYRTCLMDGWEKSITEDFNQTMAIERVETIDALRKLARKNNRILCGSGKAKWEKLKNLETRRRL